MYICEHNLPTAIDTGSCTIIMLLTVLSTFPQDQDNYARNQCMTVPHWTQSFDSVGWATRRASGLQILAAIISNGLSLWDQPNPQ